MQFEVLHTCANHLVVNVHRAASFLAGGGSGRNRGVLWASRGVRAVVLRALAGHHVRAVRAVVARARARACGYLDRRSQRLSAESLRVSQSLSGMALGLRARVQG